MTSFLSGLLSVWLYMYSKYPCIHTYSPVISQCSMVTPEGTRPIKSNYLTAMRRRGALNAFFTLDIWLGAHFSRCRRRRRRPFRGYCCSVYPRDSKSISQRKVSVRCTASAIQKPGVLLISLYLLLETLTHTRDMYSTRSLFSVFHRKCIFNDIFSDACDVTWGLRRQKRESSELLTM